MDDFGGDDFARDSEGDDDDIARFERQCAQRARDEGLLPLGPHEAESEDEDENHIRNTPKGDGDDWRFKCSVLENQISRRDAEIAQAKRDLDMVRTEACTTGDAGSELKQRLIDISKKSRRLQVTVESQKAKIQQLEAELRKPKEEFRKQAEEQILQGNSNAMLGDCLDEWKKKYLAASNKLQEVRHESQDLRSQLQKHKKVLLKELGTEEAIEKALGVADDPSAIQWKGRAAQVAQLQRQIRDLRDQVRNAGGKVDELDFEGGEGQPRLPRGPRLDTGAEKERATFAQVADKRREEFDRLQEEAEKLRGEQAEAKRKREALKSRNGMLESQLREMKTSIQTLLRKSDDDDILVDMLRQQLDRQGDDGAGHEGRQALAELRRQNQDLRAELDRQANLVVTLKQKSLSSAVENGSARLGPRSAEHGTGSKELIDRVRYLEAENARYSEQIRIFRERHEDDGGRPFSSESAAHRKERFRHMDEVTPLAERATYMQRLDSSPSHRGSSRGSSRGVNNSGVAVLIGASGL